MVTSCDWTQNFDFNKDLRFAPGNKGEGDWRLRAGRRDWMDGVRWHPETQLHRNWVSGFLGGVRSLFFSELEPKPSFPVAKRAFFCGETGCFLRNSIYFNRMVRF